jgi:non-specific serine/threonine protein kinase
MAVKLRLQQAPLPGELPRLRADLLGRRDDLDAICTLLLSDSIRLLTLTGPAGVGKTCLALEVGHEVAPHFRQGVVFVDLMGARGTGDIRVAVAERLGFRDLTRRTLDQRLIGFLAEREVLLIVDNFEQAVPTAHRLAAVFRPPGVKVLSTSREPLHLSREQVFHVQPLPVPGPERLPPLDELAKIPSVALLLRRARALDREFVLTNGNAEAIAALCTHLDGLPLAIELAAARTTFMTPAMILERLGERLSLLRWPAQDMPARHQTLRAAIAWSYDLLPGQEQALFRRLGVFEGSFSLEAAEAIAAPLAMDEVEGLGSLVDKNLVQVYGRDQDSARYALLESMRRFAHEALEDDGGLDEARGAHATYYLELAERAEPHLRGSDQVAWFDRLERAHDNIRAAFQWLIDRGRAEQALRMAAELGYFWEARGHLAEGRQRLEKALEAAPDANLQLRAQALCRLGAIMLWVSEHVERPRAVLTEALGLAREVGDDGLVALALSQLGVLGLLRKDWRTASERLETARERWQAMGDEWGAAYSHIYLGAIEFRRGRFHGARRLLEETVDRFDELGDVAARGLALTWLCYTTNEQNDLAGGLRYTTELRTLAEETQDRRLLYLTSAAVQGLLAHRGEAEELGRVLGAVSQMRAMMGMDRGGLFYTGTVIAKARDALTCRLGGEALEAAMAGGSRLSATEVFGLMDGCLRVAGEELAATQMSPPASPLSRREQQVLLLLAAGLSNKQIARELIVAESTAKTYVRGIFKKLNVETRARAVAVAAERGLLKS